MGEHKHPQDNEAQRAGAHHRQLDGRRVRGAVPPKDHDKDSRQSRRFLGQAHHRSGEEARGWHPVRTRTRQYIGSGLPLVRLLRTEAGQVQDRQASIGAHDVAPAVAGGEGVGLLLDDAQGGIGLGVPDGVDDVVALDVDVGVHPMRHLEGEQGEAHCPVNPDAFRLIADWTLASKWPATIPVGDNPRRRLRGIRLVATDADWSWGEGTEVREPADGILLWILARDPGGR